MIAVVADTHMPKGTRRLPRRCGELIAGAEAVIHAGDFVRGAVLEEIEALCPSVYAVHGNVDEPALRRLLPERREVRLAGLRLGVVHDAGPARGRIERLRAWFPSADAVVFGHSHLPLHERADGFQIFNPGSPTERRRAPRRSMGVIEAAGGEPVFRHVWLEETGEGR